MSNLILILIGFVILLLIILRFLWLKLKEAKFGQRSLSSRYGKMTEQFLPFLKDYPYPPENFRFLGTPIDGIQFEDDKIVFVEFKTGSSHLSLKQQKIADLISRKKVTFEEIQLK